jgi:hypothetical protein
VCEAFTKQTPFLAPFVYMRSPSPPPPPQRHGRMGCNGNDVVFPRVEYSSQSYPERSRRLENWPGFFLWIKADDEKMVENDENVAQLKHSTTLNLTKLKILVVFLMLPVQQIIKWILSRDEYF